MNEMSLSGKAILVTGVSRPMGIGAEIARTLARVGARVICHGSAAYDAELDYKDADSGFSDALAAEIREGSGEISLLPPSDFSVSGAPAEAVRAAAEIYGHIDGMVLNHAYSTSAKIGDWTEKHIESHLRVNVLASMLMIQEFARQLPTGARGAVTLFTSGQYLGPMTGEIAYAVSKEAIIGLCRQASAALADRNIQVNCVNPGPTDTGYLFGDAYDDVAKRFPLGKWGTPKDAARLVHFLQSDYSRWITGEVIASEGGFIRQ